jgi:WS/DGAT/MGAT family acyltransferase
VAAAFVRSARRVGRTTEEAVMDRLTALDTEFLHLEDGIAHMHIAGMSVFDGSPPSEDEISRLMLSKLHHIPRYRQRVQPVPLELGRPVWVDDAHFDITYHVRATALVSPDDTALCGLMGRLMSQELDRNRPLWEAWIVHGLPDGRWALISKVHHCMVDGIAGVGLLEALLDVEPDPAPAEPAEWQPGDPPSPAALVLDAWRGLFGDLGHRAGRIPHDLRHPMETTRSLAATAEGLVRFGRELVYTPPVSIDGSIGPHRVWAHANASLDDVKLIGKAFGGTVNDVLLSAVTNGYRELLLARGDDVGRTVLRTLVPVSVRAADDGGNRVSAILVDLPVGIGDPVVRLEAVRRRMVDRKASHMPESGESVSSFADLAPPMVVGNATRLLTRISRDHPQRALNTVTTNVPGPQFPLYCLGRRMLEHRPYVPLSHGVRVGTAMLSYDGTISFGVTGDRDGAPDVAVVAAGIVGAVEDMLDRAR